MSMKVLWKSVLVLVGLSVFGGGVSPNFVAAIDVPEEGLVVPFRITDKVSLKGMTVTMLPGTRSFDSVTTNVPVRVGGLSGTELSRMVCGHLYHSVFGAGAVIGERLPDNRTSAGHLLLDVQIGAGTGAERPRVVVSPSDPNSTESQAMAADIARLFADNLAALNLPGGAPEISVLSERPADLDKTVVVAVVPGDLNSPAFAQWMSRRGSWNTISEGLYKGLAATWKAKKDAFVGMGMPLAAEPAPAPTTSETLAAKYWKSEQKPKTQKELQGALDAMRLGLNDRTYQYFNVQALLQGEVVELRGATNMPILSKAAEQLMLGLGYNGIRNEVTLLPSPGVVGKQYGTVQVTDAFVWGDPKDGVGVLTQLLLGEPVMLLDASHQPTGEFLLVMGGDGYVGWVRAEAVLRQTAEEFAAYHKQSKAVLTQDVADGTSVALRLPASAALPIAERVGPDGLWKLGLPDGTMASVSGSVLNMQEGRGMEAASAAVNLLCSPYVFGGRSRTGLDCSGMNNVAWGTTGLTLPRDAFQQTIVGRLVATAWNKTALQPGDMIYFMDPTGRIFHSAISLGGLRFVHCSPPQVQVNSFDPSDPLYSQEWNDCFAVGRRPLP